MPCYHPVPCLKSRSVELGKFSVVPIGGSWRPSTPESLANARSMSVGLGRRFTYLEVGCSLCLGCRARRSRDWAHRAIHEARQHERNCAITLTYNDDSLPPEGHLRKSDFQKFMKRLRTDFDGKIRYLYCGEYGEKFSRPHFHALLFGIDFTEDPSERRWHHRTSDEGVMYYRSTRLERLWEHGFSEVGDMSFATAAYIAGYVQKKINGPAKAEHYGDRPPEFGHASNRPGLGFDFVSAYETDLFAKGQIVMNGHMHALPRYYRKLLERSDKDRYDSMMLRTTAEVLQRPQRSPEQLLVAEQIAVQKYRDLKRQYEKG